MGVSIRQGCLSAEQDAGITNETGECGGFVIPKQFWLSPAPASSLGVRDCSADHYERRLTFDPGPWMDYRAWTLEDCRVVSQNTKECLDSPAHNLLTPVTPSI